MRCLWLTRKFPHPANRGDLIDSAGVRASFAQAGDRLKIIACDGEEKSVGDIAELSFERIA